MTSPVVSNRGLTLESWALQPEPRSTSHPPTLESQALSPPTLAARLQLLERKKTRHWPLLPLSAKTALARVLVGAVGVVASATAQAPLHSTTWATKCWLDHLHFRALQRPAWRGELTA